MFITLKATKDGAKDAGMEQVALSNAHQGRNSRGRFGSNRRDACVGCRNKKIRCTGNRRSCDRCNIQQITCVFPPAPERQRTRGNRKVLPINDPPTQTNTGDETTYIVSNHDPPAQPTQTVSPLSTSQPELDSRAKDVVNGGFGQISLPNSHQNSAHELSISRPSCIGSGRPGLETTSNNPAATQITVSKETDVTFTDDQSGYMFGGRVQPLSPFAESLAGSSSLDISQFLADFPGTPCLSTMGPTSTEAHATQISSNVAMCSCLEDTLDIVQKLDDDAFQLRTLAFDHVLKLQKWLLFHCCKPLDCDKCTSLLQTSTIILVICGRVANMFECLSRRIQPPPFSPDCPAEEGELGSITTPGIAPFLPFARPARRKTTLDTSNSELFDISGEAAIQTPCNPEMFSAEFRAQYSYDEQLHMIRVLAKIQVRNFNQLLVRISESQQTQNSQARFGRIMSFIRRLQEAGASIDESFQIMLQSLVA
ncbi:hypothetical protein B0J13DRAFT_35319 [Dactylonectria estremocensis]|uniref:Zn(2)-C6 fungal-type domain-containing protein n=1 Tax=Dactylonectria estremocensis TaxID=1079267 RepID=A0A9P9FLQ9_9HYPO|nr:hypothetical protein B0J13DRAFT_35319 [Dactylonectria estremocensis]